MGDASKKTLNFLQLLFSRQEDTPNTHLLTLSCLSLYCVSNLVHMLSSERSLFLIANILLEMGSFLISFFFHVHLVSRQ